MAEKLNEAGYDFKKFLEVSGYKLEVPFTQPLFRDQIWRPVQIAMTGEESTTKPSTVEYTEIHRVVDCRMAEYTGVSHPFPSEEER